MLTLKPAMLRSPRFLTSLEDWQWPLGQDGSRAPRKPELACQVSHRQKLDRQRNQRATWNQLQTNTKWKNYNLREWKHQIKGGLVFFPPFSFKRIWIRLSANQEMTTNLKESNAYAGKIFKKKTGDARGLVHTLTCALDAQMLRLL